MAPGASLTADQRLPSPARQETARVGDGRLSYERIDRNETYNRHGDLVIKLETERGSTAWTAYADSDRDGLWAKLASGYGAPDLPGLATLLKSAAQTVQPPSASSGAWGEDDHDDDGESDFSAEAWHGPGRDDDSSLDHDGDDEAGRGSDSDQHVFTFGADGAVTAVAEIKENGQLKFEAIERDESCARVGAFVVKTEWDDGRSEWTVYADGNGDSRWTEVAEGYFPDPSLPELVPLGGGRTALPKPRKGRSSPVSAALR